MFSVALTLAIVLATAALSFGGAEKQLKRPPQRPRPELHVIYLSPYGPAATPDILANVAALAAAGSTIPLWNYSVVAYDGNTYQGTMVGRNPSFHGGRTTSIPTVIIPIIFHMPGGTTFDPTAVDATCGFSSSAVTLVQQSPLLASYSGNLDGVSVGTGQYTDLFQRANFWTEVSVTGNSYHTVLSPVTVLAAQSLSPTSADAIVVPKTTYVTCGPLGVISNSWFDTQIQAMFPGLAGSGVGPTVFPIFLLYNVVQSSGDPSTFPANCCILGYHAAFGIPTQTYSPLGFDGLSLFGTGYTSTMSHEIGEWMDDPLGSNLTPAWGAEGQVTAGNCQNNLEVADPLSPGFPTSTNPFSVPLNGTTYTLQELAFYSWFYGLTPSNAAGGKYSDNGTFTGTAIGCPPGGTN